ncbi:P-loop containing nucleoside triphosphate hydrolase protein [Aspergillus alliaceus]|uniref:P-loop containing nucleoside triphosphate hydrolase protein n=1 Tax=Petromyces alliaceus TaxID=209559 RepID=A0A5N7C1B4_PETAA|nr:P-loop containing nucleoside triphosphate hydrolase protein [Aspergillus alliaceus]
MFIVMLRVVRDLGCRPSLPPDTGSGKSTQVPQMILDDAIARALEPSATLSAFNLRVAKERGESLRCSVWYQIRFDSQIPTRPGSIMYCTIGSLLNMLNSTFYLDSFSHTILDEVHERALELMLFLRKFVDRHQALGLKEPKIIVMNGGHLPAPHVHIPGRAFPMGKHYLDEIIVSLFKAYSPQARSLLVHEPQTAKYLRRYNLLTIPEHPDSDERENDGNQHSNNPTVSQVIPPVYGEEGALIPIGLICAVICYILSSTDKGSILVFLLGLRHIMNVETVIRKYGKVLGCDFSDEGRYRIMQLHTNLADSEKELFSPATPNHRRIILSTDVAEASITISDVKFVTDTGKVNQRIYEPRSKTARLAFQEGEYFALFTKDMHKSFRVTRFPGMMQEDLQQTALQVKRAAFASSIQDTLRDSIEPPDEAKVDLAVNNLQLMGALDEREELTSLGDVLSEFPLDPCCAKLVLLGVIFRCLDPLLIIGSTGGDQSLFYSSANQEARKEVHRSRFAVSAFKATRDVWYRMDRASAFKFAVSKHIRFDRVCEVLHSSRHTLRFLAKKRLIPWHARLDENVQFGGADLNTNSWRVPLIKALLYHAAYPNLAAPSSASRRRYFTKTNDVTHMSPSSVNYARRPRCLFLFDSLNKPSLVDTSFLMQTSHVTPLAACILGGRLQGSGRKVHMDLWLDFLVQANNRAEGDRAARLLVELRKTLLMVR